MHVVFGFLVLNVCRISQNNADCKDFYMNWRGASKQAGREAGRYEWSVSGNWRRQHRTWTQQTCLHIFGCSISNVNRQARNTPGKHTHWHTHTLPLAHTQTLACLCLCVVLGFVCWHFSVAAFSLALPLSSRTRATQGFCSACSLQFSLFISVFSSQFFFLFFLFLSPRFLHFLCCCHCTLRQLLWRLSTKICCNFSCLAWPRFALPKDEG